MSYFCVKRPTTGTVYMCECVCVCVGPVHIFTVTGNFTHDMLLRPRPARWIGALYAGRSLGWGEEGGGDDILDCL